MNFRRISPGIRRCGSAPAVESGAFAALPPGRRHGEGGESGGGLCVFVRGEGVVMNNFW